MFGLFIFKRDVEIPLYKPFRGLRDEEFRVIERFEKPLLFTKYK